MYRARAIPCLLLRRGGLVKTVKFGQPTYLGDPINAVRIFNEREVDELVVLDIAATTEGREPPFAQLAGLATECFMPLTYGGGVTTVGQMDRLFTLGVEKVCLNSAAIEDPTLVPQAAAAFGSQSVVVSLDVKKTWMGDLRVMTRSGKHDTKRHPVEVAKQMEQAGAGELLLTSVDRDGTMAGYDLNLIRCVTEAVSIPVVACGGAGSLADFGRAVNEAGAAAAAAGSLFVFHGRLRAVLISYPSQASLQLALAPDAKVA